MELMTRYEALCNRADLLFEASCQPYFDILQCRPGCCSCCTLRSVLPIEAFVLTRAIADLASATEDAVRLQARDKSLGHCPLLLHGNCSVYGARPLICRTHGAPLAYIDYAGESIEISACPVNFAEEFTFDQKKLLFMDELNAQLQALNKQFVSQQGWKGERIALTALILQSGPSLSFPF